MDIKGHFSEVSDRNKEHVIGNWREGDPYKMAMNLAELCSSVLWKVELVSSKIRYLPEEILNKISKEWHGFLYYLQENVRGERKCVNQISCTGKNENNSCIGSRLNIY